MKSIKNRFFLLFVLCIIGAWSIIPYLYYLGALPSTHTLGWVFLISTVQAAILFGLSLWFSHLLLPKTDLDAFPKLDKMAITYGVLVGIAVGLAIIGLEKTVFKTTQMASMSTPPVWARMLASIYGGINEEVLLRLFFFTLVYFLLSMSRQNRSLKLWTTNILVALLFGVAHLPAAFNVLMPSYFEIFRILLLNGIAGIAFGWLYWAYGFFAAAIAHFVTDIVTHVIFN